MQGVILSPLLRKIDPHKCLPREYRDQYRRQFIILSYQCLRSNILDSVSQGDWKITGLGLTISLLQLDGTPTRWEFPTFDGRVPSYIQRSFDYMGACRLE
jgi:hypothetical protein